MDSTATLALVIFSLVLVLFIAGQMYVTERRRREALEEEQMILRRDYFESRPGLSNHEVHTSMERSLIVKDQKRRARQRKAARRMK